LSSTKFGSGTRRQSAGLKNQWIGKRSRIQQHRLDGLEFPFVAVAVVCSSALTKPQSGCIWERGLFGAVVTPNRLRLRYSPSPRRRGLFSHHVTAVTVFFCDYDMSTASSHGQSVVALADVDSGTTPVDFAHRFTPRRRRADAREISCSTGFTHQSGDTRRQHGYSFIRGVDATSPAASLHRRPVDHVASTLTSQSPQLPSFS
jgi:hypothetical protein